MQSDDTVVVGPYVGALAPRFRTPQILERLAGLRAWLDSHSARLVAGGGRNRHVCIDLPLEGAAETVIVKAFGRQSWVKDLRDRRRGSKARRTWLAAAHLARHGVGTPAPVGYLERWQGSRLVESYFLALYLAEVQSMREALITLFHDRPEAALFMELLERIAAGVRAMHDAGFVHNDLGAQNILLRPDGPGRWRDFHVIDLNRGRIRGELTLRERARDLARFELESHLLHLLIRMYWQGSPPEALLRWQTTYRWLRTLHIHSRSLRHPFREAERRRRERPGGRGYPEPRDMWIWDERSAQPIAAQLRRERLRLYPARRYTRTLGDTLRALPDVWRRYRAARGEAFCRPVAFAGRIGMALNPTPATLEAELELLARLGRIPAMVRFYHHESTGQRRFRAGLVRELRGAGHPVSIAVVQDRRAVLDPGAWHRFIDEVLAEVGSMVEAVEVGHNVNRAKWGVWSFDELQALYSPLPELQSRYPEVRFTGLGAIDFEYTFLLAALREWPAGVPLCALSHHLYVDRRGAPENPQGPFGTVEKLALLRAIGRRAGVERVTVTEVNWPIAGTGAHSPVLAPYVLPGTEQIGGGVSEELYGDYLIRYLCLAIGSGFAERVYWWRLAARGFGLVDDSDPTALRPRVGYAMLRAFLERLGDATLLAAQLPQGAQRHGPYEFSFRRSDGENVILVYAHGPQLPFLSNRRFEYVEDALGNRLASVPQTISGRPIYLRGVVP
jgi:tRNA A-37 threonylcarbamoyl transferase component Bud32